MFTKEKFEAGTAGIGRYKNYQLNWELEFLRGNVRVFEEHEKFGDEESFHLYIEPNLATLKAIDIMPAIKDPKTLRPYYDDANRPKGMFLGPYADLDTLESGIRMIEPFFIGILSEKGAEQRLLHQRESNSDLVLIPTRRKTEATFTDALVTARDREIFVALKQGKILPFDQMVGRVFRSLANTLGVDYHIQEEKLDGAKEAKAVTFTYEGIGGFRFENNGENQPVSLTRYSYGGHKQFGNSASYFVTFEGPATTENMQEKVFNWLIDAMMDVSADRLHSDYDYEAFVKNRKTAAQKFRGAFSQDNGSRQTSTGIVLKLV